MPGCCGRCGQKPEHGTRWAADHRQVQIFDAPFAPGRKPCGAGLLRAIRTGRMRRKAQGIKARSPRQPFPQAEWSRKSLREGRQIAGISQKFSLAGGQCRSRQRIVGMREYSTWSTVSRGRAFDSNTAAASTGLSGSRPLLHSVHLPSSVDNHAAGAICRKQCRKSASLRHAEACGIRLFHERAGVPQTQQRRQSRFLVEQGQRFYLSAGSTRVSFKNLGKRRFCHAFARRDRQERYRDAGRACASHGFRLTAASIADIDRAAFWWCWPIMPVTAL